MLHRLFGKKTPPKRDDFWNDRTVETLLWVVFLAACFIAAYAINNWPGWAF